MRQILLTKIEKVINEIDDKVEEYASNITGHPESKYMDILYEDYIVFMEEVRNKLDFITEIIYTDNEGLQEASQ